MCLENINKIDDEHHTINFRDKITINKVNKKNNNIKTTLNIKLYTIDEVKLSNPVLGLKTDINNSNLKNVDKLVSEFKTSLIQLYNNMPEGDEVKSTQEYYTLNGIMNVYMENIKGMAICNNLNIIDDYNPMYSYDDEGEVSCSLTIAVSLFGFIDESMFAGNFLKKINSNYKNERIYFIDYLLKYIYLNNKKFNSTLRKNYGNLQLKNIKSFNISIFDFVRVSIYFFNELELIFNIIYTSNYDSVSSIEFYNEDVEELFVEYEDYRKYSTSFNSPFLNVQIYNNKINYICRRHYNMNYVPENTIIERNINNNK